MVGGNNWIYNLLICRNFKFNSVGFYSYFMPGCGVELVQIDG